MARHHHRRPLQRHLAGHAELSVDAVARIALRFILATETKKARRIIRRAVLKFQ
jgi:hypothetical protein